MAINWFPGHMRTARKKAEETLANVDVVIEVLDARCPAASVNPMIEAMRLERERPALKIINKIDLAEEGITQAWLAHFNALPNTKAIAISCKKVGDSAKVLPAARTLAPHREGPLKRFRVMTMGIPNVGKSTLINALMNSRTAPVGDEPAVTKLVSRYNLPDGTWLFDTPGLMWPKIELESDGLLLAASNLIGTNAYINEEVATYLAEILLDRYASALAKRYAFDDKTMAELDGPGVIEAIALKRGFKAKGGAIDYEKASVTLLNDFRSGIMGRMSLETPQTRNTLLAARAAALAEAQAPDA
ncbi:MAG: ribosome biogenesis GTPase YlqF [Burkholderiales bacterium]|nr:MAG: ribosome biogenesis GTPase YlqF [Burkholderiales bacterium]